MTCPGFSVASVTARSVLHQHSLTQAQWEDRIKNAWSKLKGIPRHAPL